MFSVSPGGGFTFGIDRRLVYAMFETELQLTEHYRDSFMLGFGGSFGTLIKLGKKLKLKIDGR
ncbi:MAG: hypothetical protein GWN14_05975, partial [candidate division Zixibacteria bacterium]|nr:hypothetical protein [candidate division Zixibacteria bacterium]